MNLAEMITAAVRDGADEDERGLTDEQQITRLQEFFAQAYAAEPERFESGQIIWHKNPAAADFSGAKDPHMFIGYLDRPVAGVDHISDASDFGSNAFARIVDCRAASIRHGETFAVHLVDSRVFTATKPRS